LVIVNRIKSDGKSFYIHEIKQMEAVEPIVKGIFRINNLSQTTDIVSKALHLAKAGDPGPVVIEILDDLSGSEKITDQKNFNIEEKKSGIDKKKIGEIVNIFKSSKCCGIYVGKGAFSASKQIIELAEILAAPIATTVSGKGVVPDDYPLSVGFGFGPSGTETAENIFQTRDTLIAVGCKFSEMATGQWGFKIPERLIHIDINEDVLNKNYKATISLCADAAQSINEILMHKSEIQKEKNVALIDEINERKEKHAKQREDIQCLDSVHPSRFFYELRKQMKRGDILTVDCGYHQLWSLTEFEVYEPGTFITSCDYQAMGFAIPAAIGAKIAHPDREVACVCGDGGFLISAFELLTAKRENANIKVFVFNDGELGLIRHSQLKTYGRGNSISLTNVDFNSFAQAIGIEYVKISNDDQLPQRLEEIIECKKSVIVDVKISYSDEPRYFKGVAKTFWNKLTNEEKLKLAGKIRARGNNEKKSNRG